MASTPLLNVSLTDDMENVEGEILPFLDDVYNRKYAMSNPVLYSGGDFRLPSTSRTAKELYDLASRWASERTGADRVRPATFVAVYDWVLQLTGKAELQDLILLPVASDSAQLPAYPGAAGLSKVDGKVTSFHVLKFVEKNRSLNEYLSMVSILTFRYNVAFRTLVATTRRDTPSQLFNLTNFGFLTFPSREYLVRLIVNGTTPAKADAQMSLEQALSALMKVGNPFVVFASISWYIYPTDGPDRADNIAELNGRIIDVGWRYWDVFFQDMVDYEVGVNKVPKVEARNKVIKRVIDGFIGPNDYEVVKWLTTNYASDKAVFDILLQGAIKWHKGDNALLLLRQVDDWPREIAAYHRALEFLLATALAYEDDKIVSSALTNLTTSGKFSSNQIRDALWIIGASDHAVENMTIALQNADAYGLIDPKTTRFESRNGVLLSLSEFAGTFGDLRTAGTVLQWALKNGAPYPRGPIVQSEWLEANRPLWNTVMSNMNTKRPIVDLVDDMFQPQ